MQTYIVYVLGTYFLVQYKSFSAIILTPIDCCFRYGFGARAIPCCLETITCEEHDKLVEDGKEVNEPVCMKDKTEVG